MGITLDEVEKALSEAKPIPHYRKGPHVRFKAAELDEYVSRLFSEEFNPDTDSDGGWEHITPEGPPAADESATVAQGEADSEINWGEKTSKRAVILGADGKPYQKPVATGPINVRGSVVNHLGQVYEDAQIGADAELQSMGLPGSFGVLAFESPVAQSILAAGRGLPPTLTERDLRPDKEHEGVVVPKRVDRATMPATE